MVCAKLILFYWRREELWFKPSQIQRTTVASGTIPLLFPLGVATVTILIILQRMFYLCTSVPPAVRSSLSEWWALDL